MIDESKNVQTTPTRTYYKYSRPLSYCNQNCRTPRHWKFTQHHRTSRPPYTLPDREKLHEWNKLCPKAKVIVLDILLQKASASNDIVDLFCVLSSHMYYTVLFLVQNLFGDSKRLRTISLNSHYFIIFKNPRHQQQVQILGSQIVPKQTDFFMSSYMKAVSSRSYGYY